MQANLKKARFGNGMFMNAIFEKAELAEADFSGAVLEEAYFGHAVAVGARFVNAKLREASFAHADVSAADFSGAGLYRTRFHATRRVETVLPRGSGWLEDDEELAGAEAWQAPSAPADAARKPAERGKRV